MPYLLASWWDLIFESTFSNFWGYIWNLFHAFEDKIIGGERNSCLEDEFPSLMPVSLYFPNFSSHISRKSHQRICVGFLNFNQYIKLYETVILKKKAG